MRRTNHFRTCASSRRWGILVLLLLVFVKVNLQLRPASVDDQVDQVQKKKNNNGATSSAEEAPPLVTPSPSPPTSTIYPRHHGSSTRPRVLTNPDSIFSLIDPADLTRRPHFLTTLSGCRIARWIVPILGERPFRRDCYKEQELALTNPTTPRVLTNETVRLLQTNDTIYITYDQVEDFVKDSLPCLQISNVQVVLISGQREYIRAPSQSAIDQILKSPSILYWFCQNLPKYGGTKSSLGHPKLASFPFGIKQKIKDGPLQATNGKDYETVFRESLQALRLSANSSRKTNEMEGLESNGKDRMVFAGYITVASNEQSRSNIAASTTFLPPLDFYRSIASSRYVLSPNGDRPECYRHYEALGLGTAPITQLTRANGLFDHFQGSGLLFQQDHDFVTWDVNELEKRLDPHPVVNRNLILEEYWMEYVDWYTNRELTWWDRYYSEDDDSHGTGRPVTVPMLLAAALK